MTEVRDHVDHDLLIVEEIEEVAASSRRRRRRLVVVVIVAFVLTRAVAGYIADHPSVYGNNRADGTGDVHYYDQLTWEIRHEGKNPYGEEMRVEYPPGAIPVMMVPRYLRAISYRTEFIMMMVAFDALGLYALVRIARRTGSYWGAATWFLLVPALGPVAYTRLDLVIAVLLAWTMERALAQHWQWVGLLVGVGTVMKLIPLLLLPLLFFVAPRDKRRALVGWCALVVGVVLLPWIGRLPDVYRSVITYHTERGVQAESLWGSVVMALHWVTDLPAAIVGSHRAFDVSFAASDSVKLASTLTVGAVVLGGTALAIRNRVDVRNACLLVFGFMSLLVGFGSVYSPQYILWLIALGAIAMAVAPRETAPAIGVLAVVTVLAHLLFPVWFWDLLFYDKGGAVIALVVRNVLTVAIGGLALWGWYRLVRRTDDQVIDLRSA